jgi:hypothetical protein
MSLFKSIHTIPERIASPEMFKLIQFFQYYKPQPVNDPVYKPYIYQLLLQEKFLKIYCQIAHNTDQLILCCKKAYFPQSHIDN